MNESIIKFFGLPNWLQILVLGEKIAEKSLLTIFNLWWGLGIAIWVSRNWIGARKIVQEIGQLLCLCPILVQTSGTQKDLPSLPGIIPIDCRTRSKSCAPWDVTQKQRTSKKVTEKTFEVNSKKSLIGHQTPVSSVLKILVNECKWSWRTLLRRWLLS